LYHRIFESEKINKYNPALGSFRTWLGRVILNEIRDWLKSAHSHWAVSKKDEVGWHGAMTQNTISLDQPLDTCDPEGDSYAACVAAAYPKQEEMETEDGKFMEQALCHIPEEQRVLFEIYAISFRPLSGFSRSWLAQAHGITEESLDVLLAEFVRELQSLTAETLEQMEEGLAVCHGMREKIELQLRAMESELIRRGRQQAEMKGWFHDAQNATFGALEAAVKAAKDTPTQEKVVSLCANYQLKAKRWKKWHDKYEKASADYHNTHQIRLPSYRSLARLLNKPETAIPGALHRTKQNLLRYWENSDSTPSAPSLRKCGVR
jgi:RNA polymerase sigma factor (sigma-70 family)